MQRILLLFIGLQLSALAPAMPGGGNGESNSFMEILPNGQIRPMLWGSIQTRRDYFEARFNYEDQNTLSFFYGRPFYVEKRKLQLELVPSFGLSGGVFTGASPCFYVYGESKKIEFYSTNQFSISIKKFRQSFLFNWSEVAYKWKNHMKIGASIQVQYDMRHSPSMQSGLLLGVMYNKFCAQVYLFNPWERGRTYMAGLTYNFNFKPYTAPAPRRPEERPLHPPVARI